MKKCEECNHELRDNDDLCTECGEPQPVPVQLDQLENPFQTARWREVLEHGIIVEKAQTLALDPAFVNLTINTEDADTWGIYPELCLDHGGNIAENVVNQPYYYATFGQLLQAAAVRMATT